MQVITDSGPDAPATDHDDDMTRAGRAMLEVRDLTVKFADVVALSEATLRVGDRELITLLGPSGSGKTTLLRAIAGFQEPASGDVLIDGTSVLGVPPERRPVNTVFQKYALFPHLDVRGNVAFGLEVSGVGRVEASTRVDDAIEMVRLNELADRRIDQLSGGQQQRVALARAIINRPALLLLDEPLGALDLKLRREMQLELRSLQRRLGMTFIHVTHDQEEALALSDRIAVMSEGRIVQFDTPEAIYSRPRSRFVAEFVGETNLFDADLDNGIVKLPWADPVRFVAPLPDGPVTMSVRPEDIRIDGPAERPGGSERIVVEARVLDAVFAGADVRYLVRIADAQEAVVRGRPGVEPGTRVSVSWQPGRMVAIEVEG